MPLILLPAVDVVEGRAVHSFKGRPAARSEYGSAVDANVGLNAARKWIIWWTYAVPTTVPCRSCRQKLDITGTLFRRRVAGRGLRSGV